MSELKCPFCQQELQTRSENVQPDAESRSENVLTKSLRMDKEFAEEELERTRKALDVAVGAIDEILYLDSGKFIQEPAEMWKIAKSAKDKITALEQKD